MCFTHSTVVWDVINDKKIQLRKNYRIIKGGVLIATNGMVQGEYRFKINIKVGQKKVLIDVTFP